MAKLIPNDQSMETILAIGVAAYDFLEICDSADRFTLRWKKLMQARARHCNGSTADVIINDMFMHFGQSLLSADNEWNYYEAIGQNIVLNMPGAEYKIGNICKGCDLYIVHNDINIPVEVKKSSPRQAHVKQLKKYMTELDSPIGILACLGSMSDFPSDVIIFDWSHLR